MPAARPSPRRSPDPPVPDDPVPYDPDKLAELMLLAAEGLQTDPTYGATKLNKALFFGDFLHHKRHGRPISGAAYLRLPRALRRAFRWAVERWPASTGKVTLEFLLKQFVTTAELPWLERRNASATSPRRASIKKGPPHLVSVFASRRIPPFFRAEIDPSAETPEPAEARPGAAYIRVRPHRIISWDYSRNA